MILPDALAIKVKVDEVNNSPPNSTTKNSHNAKKRPPTTLPGPSPKAATAVV